VTGMAEVWCWSNAGGKPCHRLLVTIELGTSGPPNLTFPKTVVWELGDEMNGLKVKCPKHGFVTVNIDEVRAARPHRNGKPVKVKVFP